MSLTRYLNRSIDDEALCALSGRFQSLQHELDSLQQEYHQAYAHHGQQCVSSLHGSVKRLFDVLNRVKKADKALVDWHYRSDALKRTLRVFGVDRRTNSVIKKTTDRLKKEIASVEADFNKANGVFEEGVAVATDLEGNFARFSVRSVGTVSQKAKQTRDAYDQDREEVEGQIRAQNSKHNEVRAELDGTTELLQQLREQRGQSQTMRSAMAAGSLGSFGLAATSALFFPPSLMVTGSLAALGMGTGVAAYSYDNQVRALERESEELRHKLESYEASTQQLKVELANLAENHSRYTDALQKVDDLQDKTRAMRAEAEQAAEELRQAKVLLDGVQNRLSLIAEQLEECQYARTRKDIATRLREVVVSIQGISEKQVLWLTPNEQKRRIWRGQDHIRKAMLALAEIDERTGTVMQIAWLLDQGSR